MAGADGRTPDHLTYLRKITPDLKRFGFFAILRRLEARAPGLPRIGRSRLPEQNIIDLAQEPTLEFPASTVTEVEPAPGGRARLRGLFFGLTGPMGPLPTHLTEYAFYERRSATARPFGRWLDLLAERMMQFFYRAWADTQPAAQADRPGEDRFADYAAAISGVSDARARQASESAFNPLHYAGAFASRRSAAVLQDALSHLLHKPVRVQEFVVRWRDVAPFDRTRLGGGQGFNQLGVDTMLGARVCVAEDTFRVKVRAEGIDDYVQFLPGHARHRAARDALTALKPSHLDWEIELELNEMDAPGARLDGASQLGFATWLAPQGRPVVRADARIRA